MELTRENWKDYRESEAKRIFSVDAIVQYNHGFTRSSSDNFGKITRITPAGNIYVQKINLECVSKAWPDEGPEWQAGGEMAFDPEQFELLEEIVRFWPEIYHSHEDKGYIMRWHGKEGSGMSMLRPVEVGEDGLVRGNWAGIL